MMSAVYRICSRFVLLTALAAALAGCPQTAPTPPNASDPTPVKKPAMPAPAPTSHKPAPHMGGPMPPQTLPQPVKLDDSCRAESDCAVKNVGSCCGMLPSCVNKNSPTDPAGVKAQCAKEGKMSSCGYRDIKRCGCHQGRCMSTESAPVGAWLDDPPLPPDPVR